MPVVKPPPYVTSPDRAGAALAAGGGLAGLVIVALIVAGGQRAAWAIVGGWLLGSLFAMCAIVAVAGPIWIVLHAIGRRGPVAAALTGMAMALAVFAVGQGSGVLDRPIHHIASVLGAGAVIALAAGGIGWTMQRIAYRRLT